MKLKQHKGDKRASKPHHSGLSDRIKRFRPKGRVTEGTESIWADFRKAFLFQRAGGESAGSHRGMAERAREQRECYFTIKPPKQAVKLARAIPTQNTPSLPHKELAGHGRVTLTS